MESEREGRNSDFGILKVMWIGERELRSLGDGLETWKLSVVKGMNVCWTQLYIPVSKFHLEFIQIHVIIIITIAKCFLLYLFS